MRLDLCTVRRMRICWIYVSSRTLRGLRIINYFWVFSANRSRIVSAINSGGGTAFKRMSEVGWQFLICSWVLVLIIFLAWSAWGDYQLETLLPALKSAQHRSSFPPPPPSLSVMPPQPSSGPSSFVVPDQGAADLKAGMRGPRMGGRWVVPLVGMSIFMVMFILTFLPAIMRSYRRLSDDKAFQRVIEKWRRTLADKLPTRREFIRFKNYARFVVLAMEEDSRGLSPAQLREETLAEILGKVSRIAPPRPPVFGQSIIIGLVAWQTAGGDLGQILRAGLLLGGRALLRFDQGLYDGLDDFQKQYGEKAFVDCYGLLLSLCGERPVADVALQNDTAIAD